MREYLLLFYLITVN